MYPDLYCLLIALGIGVIIGAEREYRSKSAGLRTMIMVIWVPANILTGLDLLGKGGIFKDENHKKLTAYLLNDSNIQELCF